MIPPGSGKPDYQQRLRYAFRDEKKIVKHQDRLKEVQHMFMFMTTCWMYQLPAARSAPQTKQPPSLNASDNSSGSFHGVMQQVPMHFNLKGLGGNSDSLSYEATLTLKPVLLPETVQVSRPVTGETSGRTSQGREKVDISKTQKESLENMRRSPYFSLNLLRPPIEAVRYGGRERESEEARRRTEESEVRKNEEVRKNKSEERGDFEVPSRDEADRDIVNLLSGVSIAVIVV